MSANDSTLTVAERQRMADVREALRAVHRQRPDGPTVWPRRAPAHWTAREVAALASAVAKAHAAALSGEPATLTADEHAALAAVESYDAHLGPRTGPSAHPSR